MEKLLILSLSFADGLKSWLADKTPTGTASIFYLADKCAENGVEVYWVMLDWKGPLPGGVAVHKKGLVTIECVLKPSEKIARYFNDTERGLLHRFLRVFDVLPIYKKLSSIADQFSPDLIYSVGVYSIFGATIAKRRSIPSVTRMLGIFLTHYLKRWWKPSKTWNEILTLMFRPDLLIITNDGTGGDRVAEYFNIPKDQFWFPINGVHKPPADRCVNRDEILSKYGLPTDAPIIISVGRLVAWKRMDHLIDGFSLVVKKLNPEPHLVILGDGPDRHQLEEQVRLHSLSRSITLLGNVEKIDLYNLLFISNVAAFTYEYTNVGSALLEAVQAGKPVITLANGDTDKFVVNGETGLLLDENSTPTTLANAIIKILNDKELAVRLANGALRWADKNLKTWDERMNEEYTYLEKLVSTRKEQLAQKV